jgi:dihydrofolate reductase
VPVTLIAAVAANGVIGNRGALPWHLPADLKRFQRLTSGHHLVVGRATWESVGRPLPDRTFVVVTRRPGEARPGLAFARSVEEGIRLAQRAGDAEPFVAGGSGIFREALERGLVDRLQLTAIHRDYEGDARFPELDLAGWRLVESEPHAADPVHDRPAFEFRVYERERPSGAGGRR